MKSENLGLITKDECEDPDVANITKEIADLVKHLQITLFGTFYFDYYSLVLD